ncbi:hypothetical protein C8035_v005279 [Colletotrichum spinosum]|uniref:Uncharacterized protein n=1 Tax=Colletotrichum spinosum TaxID=1347390 RepID=A0A4R8Q7T4_9PEZI|nr:hypothetical protein C8035_v005279 [Colletotrichum spinosum]
MPGVGTFPISVSIDSLRTKQAPRPHTHVHGHHHYHYHLGFCSYHPYLRYYSPSTTTATSMSRVSGLAGYTDTDQCYVPSGLAHRTASSTTQARRFVLRDLAELRPLSSALCFVWTPNRNLARNPASSPVDALVTATSTSSSTIPWSHRILPPAQAHTLRRSTYVSVAATTDTRWLSMLPRPNSCPCPSPCPCSGTLSAPYQTMPCHAHCMLGDWHSCSTAPKSQGGHPCAGPGGGRTTLLVLGSPGFTRACPCRPETLPKNHDPCACR